MKSTVIKKIIMTLITVLFLAYLIYIIIGTNFNSIETESAVEMTVTDSISVSGYFIRDETLIEYDGDGVISYTVSDSSKVAGGEAVAEVFLTAEDATAQEEIKKLEEQIATLEALEKSAELISVSPDELDEDISTELFNMSSFLSDGNISDVGSFVDNILYYINERQLTVGKIDSFSDTISELQSRIDELESDYSAAQDQIVSDEAGYFVSFADGYEGLVSVDDIEDILPEDLETILQTQPSEVSDTTVGKTITNVFWYIACQVTYEEALVLKGSSRITISLPFASAEDIPVTVISVNQENSTSDGVVILRGEYMNEELSTARIETVELNINTYTGIYVSKKAVREMELTKTVTNDDGTETEVTESVMGVYVVQGNELVFKQIAVIYSGDDYYICSEDPESDEEDGVSMEIEIFSYDYDILELYDEVVVEGANLYDGKLVV